MKVSISFHKIQVNLFQNKKELIFPYGDDWYRMDWENVPEQYKIMYVAWLKFQGIEVPEDLKQYEKDTIDLSNLSVEIDLDSVEKISENYPLG